MRTTSRLILLITALGLAAPALAGPSIFAGGGAGYLRVEDDSIDGDENDFTYKVFAGLNLGDSFGLEVAYLDFGETGDTTNSLSADGVTAAAIAAIGLTDNFSLYGKGGALFWNVDRESENVEKDDFDPFFGVGARIDLAKLLQLRLEYERFEIDGADFDVATANLQFVFGFR